MEINLSKNFTLSEFVDSPTAKKNRIDNTPTSEIISNLNMLCTNVLEPLRSLLKKPINLNSGYRCKALNTALGGSKNSQHMEGKAADFHVAGFSTQELFEFIISKDLRFDQCIMEFPKSGAGWVHISWNGVKNRGEKLRADKFDGKTVYTKVV